MRFSWNAPEQVGAFALKASIPGQPGSERQIDARVLAGDPHVVERLGNNQAAVAGMRLPAPLGVAVYDRFGNPVAAVPVTFQVNGGTGRLGQHGATAKLPTDPDGVAAMPFVVSSEAGQNHVAVTVEGQEPVELVAFGTEV